VITQVQAAAQASLQYSPNVVLINAGTNDCLQSLDIENAGARMQSLVNMLLDNINGTTVVLSTLIPCKDATAEANRPSVNSQYRALVTSLQSQGKKAVLADMDPSSNPEYWNESTDFADDVHPNDGGYKKMADVWFDTIERAITDRKIAISAKPLVSEGSGGYSKTCKQGAFAVAFLLCVGDFI
jgi:lysophospholipase L1-like esterase